MKMIFKPKGTSTDLSFFIRIKLKATQLSRATISLFLISYLTLAIGCGSSGDGDSGEIIGTGISQKTIFAGTAADGVAIADSELTIKSSRGTSITTVVDSNGQFADAELIEIVAEGSQAGPFLLSIETQENQKLYSIAHIENASNVDESTNTITINVHPYTDLIVRNWFAQQGLDIDSALTGGNAIELPSTTEINSIEDALTSIFSLAFEVNGVAENTDLLSTPFAVEQTGFNRFLQNSQVALKNNRISVVVSEVEVADPIQNSIIQGVGLDDDFTDANDLPPSLPTTVKALATDTLGTVRILWNPSSDDKGITQYNIRRNGELIESTPFSSYTDSDLNPGSEYTYTIEAIDSRMQSSGLSNTVSIIVPEMFEAVTPATATDLQISDNNGIVTLSWNQSSPEVVASYQVLRGPSGGAVNQVANITTTSFDDFTVSAGNTHCYRVVSVDGVGNQSIPSQEICVTVSGGGNEQNSSVTLSSATYTVDESAGAIKITVQRDGDLSEVISVDFVVSALTATPVTDFTVSSGTLNWEATDAAVKTFYIHINENLEAEVNETISVSLLNPAGTSLGPNSSAIVTIVDAPQVSCIDLNPTLVTVDTTLSEPCYNVLSDIDVQNNAVLTINSGVRMNFASDTHLEIDSGHLEVSGSAEAPVLFTSASANPARGDWVGLNIDAGQTGTIDYAIVEYAGSSGDVGDIGLAGLAHGFTGLNEGNTTLSLTNSIVRHNQGSGVELNSAVLSFSNNIVSLNESFPVTVDTSTQVVGALTNTNTFVGNDVDYIMLTEVAFPLTVDQVWNKLDVDYRIQNTVVTAEVQARFTLAPGVSLRFDGDTPLVIGPTGSLRSIGTPQQPILLSGPSNLWEGITLNSSNDNVIDNSIIENGDSNGALITLMGNAAIITNNLIRNSANNGIQIGIGTSGETISGNTFENISGVNILDER